MAKKIAIDLNDVIRDYTSQFIDQYTKNIDPDCEIELEDVTDFDFYNVFKFDSREDYSNFKYVDYAYELFLKAQPMDRMLSYRFNDWLQTTLRDLEEENIPEVMFVSPLEANLTIQATLGFLSKLPSRVREIYFPVDSATIWDRCDILITANPNLISNVPEGKTVIKVEAPYNKDVECEHTFKSMIDIITDKEETIIKLLEQD
jgi:hypothetical protein